MKSEKWGKWISVLLYVALGGALGWALGNFLSSGQVELPLGEKLLLLGGVLLLVYLAGMLQTILHETGHLLFGLLSGYRFCSFRIGQWMLARQNGALRFCRFFLAGTAGQCLMDPPDMREGKLPYVLYNLGGVILNAASALLFFWMYHLCASGAALFAFFCLALGLMGAAGALLNGIPMRVQLIDNDGRNACSLGKDPAALRAFWLQLRINAAKTSGQRLRDMPVAWFRFPAEAELQNPMIAAEAVGFIDCQMDLHKFAQAARTIDWLLHAKTGLLGLHRNLLLCDRLYCALLLGEDAAPYDTPAMAQFRKQMAPYPSVIRTEYARALLAERDEAKAAAFQARFDKLTERYPYQGDLESDRECMELARRVAQGCPLQEETALP